MPILTYQLLQPGHKDFPQAETLYTEAFPSCERRDLGKWRMLAANALAPFTIWGLYAEAQFVGFISFWQFDGFIYVEHFAILATQRGGGCGRQTMRLLREAHPSVPIVLEVEPPTDETTQRRIAFYERCGFSLSPLPYLQPPYRPTDQAFPLRLMTTAPDYLAAHSEQVVQTIHWHVYGCK